MRRVALVALTALSVSPLATASSRAQAAAVAKIDRIGILDPQRRAAAIAVDVDTANDNARPRGRRSLTRSPAVVWVASRPTVPDEPPVVPGSTVDPSTARPEDFVYSSGSPPCSCTALDDVPR